MGAAPNTPATGSHTDVHTKGRPKRRMAGHALIANSLTSATSNSGSVSAKTVSAPRYKRSPTFAPRSTCQRGSGAAARSIGSVVIGRNVSGLRHETVTAGGGTKNTDLPYTLQLIVDDPE